MKKLLSFLMVLFFSAGANADTLNLISDEETEVFLHKMVRPIFNAANVAFNPNKIFIVNDNSLNAFVSDGNYLFIHTGTIINAGDKSEIEGVIAHETGHIIGGHILRMKLKHKEIQMTSLASLIVAAAAGAASGRGDVTAAVMLGSQSSLLTQYLGYRVEEERSADEAAVKILTQLHKSPAGLLRFMKFIQKQNSATGIDENSFYSDHPGTMERVTFLENAIKNSPYPSHEVDEEFNRVKAKLIAYLDEPKRTLQKYPVSDQSIAAKYARSIAYFKQMNIPNSIKELEQLIEIEQNNPYFHELKGQVYLETGKLKAAREEYQKALNLRPNSVSFQQNLAQVILEEENPSKADIDNAIKILNKAVLRSPSPYSWLMLSRAYGMRNDMANSNYAAAEYSFRIGAVEIAQKQVGQAKDLSKSSALSLKIDDLLARINEVIEKKTRNFR